MAAGHMTGATAGPNSPEWSINVAVIVKSCRRDGSGPVTALLKG